MSHAAEPDRTIDQPADDGTHVVDLGYDPDTSPYTTLLRLRNGEEVWFPTLSGDSVGVLRARPHRDDMGKLDLHQPSLHWLAGCLLGSALVGWGILAQHRWGWLQSPEQRLLHAQHDYRLATVLLAVPFLLGLLSTRMPVRHRPAFALGVLGLSATGLVWSVEGMMSANDLSPYRGFDVLFVVSVWLELVSLVMVGAMLYGFTRALYREPRPEPRKVAQLRRIAEGTGTDFTPEERKVAAERLRRLTGQN